MTPATGILAYLAIAGWWTGVLTVLSLAFERIASPYKVPLRNHVREVRRWGILWPISMPVAGIVVPAITLLWGAVQISNRRR